LNQLNLGLVATGPGGTAASEVDGFCLKQKPKLQTLLAIQFSETDRRRGDVSSSVPNGDYRRGMLLIRDDFSFVNGDRKNFPPPRSTPAIIRSSRRFSGEKFYPIQRPGTNSITNVLVTTGVDPGKRTASI
jgi:hypothetical protein